VDELGPPGSKGVGAEPELVRQAGTQALDEDVGAVDEPQQHLDTAAEVDCGRALPRVRRDEQGPQIAGEGRPPRARLVARRWLDFDHVGPERAEQLRAGRACVRRGDVHHTYAREWGERH
jgi:hypothetical protein